MHPLLRGGRGGSAHGSDPCSPHNRGTKNAWSPTKGGRGEPSSTLRPNFGAGALMGRLPGTIGTGQVVSRLSTWLPGLWKLASHAGDGWSLRSAAHPFIASATTSLGLLRMVLRHAEGNWCLSSQSALRQVGNLDSVTQPRGGEPSECVIATRRITCSILGSYHSSHPLCRRSEGTRWISRASKLNHLFPNLWRRYSIGVRPPARKRMRAHMCAKFESKYMVEWRDSRNLNTFPDAQVNQRKDVQPTSLPSAMWA